MLQECFRFNGCRWADRRASWNDAVAFCKRLWEVAQEHAAGRTYRLPTEAEWEYACRAGGTTKYSFGDLDSELASYAWYDKNSRSLHTHPVGQKQPNAWGVVRHAGQPIKIKLACQELCMVSPE